MALFDYHRLGALAALAENINAIGPEPHVRMVYLGRGFAHADERFRPTAGAAILLGAFEAVLDGGGSSMTTAGIGGLLAHAASHNRHVRPYIRLLPPAPKFPFVASQLRPAASAFSQNLARVASYLRRYLRG